MIGFLSGTVMVLDAPARQALTYRMVGPHELANAVALNSSLFNGARIFGPGIGGLVIAAFGAGVCFALNAVSFLAVLAGLLAMRVQDLHPVTGQERPTLLRGVTPPGRGSHRFVLTRRTWGALIAATTLAITLAIPGYELRG